MAALSLSELLNLPPDARADLAMALWESLSETERDRALPRDPALLQELDRRWAEHIAHPESAVPWEEVQRRLRS
jgi:putative addiction module component (TIGR02574 family)